MPLVQKDLNLGVRTNMQNKISDRLRFVMSQTNNPKLLELCSKISYLDIKVQESLLDCIEQGIDMSIVLLALQRETYKKIENDIKNDKITKT